MHMYIYVELHEWTITGRKDLLWHPVAHLVSLSLANGTVCRVGYIVRIEDTFLAISSSLQ